MAGLWEGRGGRGGRGRERRGEEGKGGKETKFVDCWLPIVLKAVFKGVTGSINATKW